MRNAKTVATTKAGLSKAVPGHLIKRMPEILSRPSAVLWDKTKNNLTYVFNVSKDPRKGKFVVTVNYKFSHRPGGGKKITQAINEVTTAGMAESSNLKEPGIYELISGAL